EYVPTQVVCSCGNSFVTRSTKSTGHIHAEACSNCHPCYTGKQKILDTGGRVAKFEARYGKRKKELDASALQGLLDEYAELERQLADPAVHADAVRARKLGRRYAELKPIVTTCTELSSAQDDLAAAREL